MSRIPHDPAAVREELERVLASRLFSQAERHKAFLQFVVEETLAGRSDRLKGYTIGVEVFGRPEDFDAQSDPLVRVEAGRLRRRLTDYYATEGRDNAGRLALHRGSYAVSYSQNPDLDSAGDVPRKRRKVIAWSLTACALLAVVAGAVLNWPAQPPTVDSGPNSVGEVVPALPAAAAVQRPTLMVVPFADLSEGAEFGYFSYGITEEIILRLRDFDYRVLRRPTAYTDDEAILNGRSLPMESGVDYVLTGTIRSAANRVRVTARLVDESNGAQLWGRPFDEDLSEESALDVEQRIANLVVRGTAVVYGPVFRRELETSLARAPLALGSYDCTLRLYHYRRTYDRTRYFDTLDCFERVLRGELGSAGDYSGLATLYLDDYLWGFTASTGDELLARARELTQTALDINGDDVLANLSMARMRFIEGDRDGFERSALRVEQLGRVNPEALGTLASYLTFGGDYERGVALADEALSLTPDAPGWYYNAHVVERLRSRDGAGALSYALRIDAPNWYFSPLLVSASAGMADNREIAQRALQQLATLNEGFGASLEERMARGLLDPEVRDAIREGLRLAGAELPSSAIEAGGDAE